MFIHCPHCQSLVATDPATGEPPDRCPRCSELLAEPAARTAAPDRNDPDDVREQERPPAQDAPAIEAGQALADGIAPGDEEATPPPTSHAPSQPQQDTAPDLATGEPETLGVADAAATHADEATTEVGGATDAAITPTPVDVDHAGNSSDDYDRDEAAIGTAAPAAPPPLSVARPGGPAPRFAQVRAPAAANNGTRRWLQPSLIAGLSLLLALQWSLADRQRLAADARWRSFVIQLCGVMRCEVPPWREPAAFVLLDRDVRPHPDLPGVLSVSATFRNAAHWAQPWPEMVLTLSDLEGSVVGRRSFSAEQYLGVVPTQETLASGQTATIRLQVIEPLPRSVAFAFDFR